MANDTIINKSQRVAEAQKCTLVGFVLNGVLSLLKIAAGVIGRSSAMLADGVHSVSDFVTDIIVVLFIRMTKRNQDARYRYGYGKFETFATMLISVMLICVAVMIFCNGMRDVRDYLQGEELVRPGMIALVMAIVSIVSKELLYQYTRKVGERINSKTVIANAWHHRSDAFSSIATMIGVGGAILLGEKWRILDPLAAMIVSIFIAIMGCKLLVPAVQELLEISLPKGVNEQICEIVKSVDGVKTFHHLRTRHNGSTIVVEFHIKVDPEISITEAHAISTEVEDSLREVFPDAIINIHIEPYAGEKILSDGTCED